MVNFPDDAQRLGEFVVHRPLTGGKGWVVSHEPSTHCMLRVKLKGDATKAARALAFLWENLCPETQEKVFVELRERLYSCDEY